MGLISVRTAFHQATVTSPNDRCLFPTFCCFVFRSIFMKKKFSQTNLTRTESRLATFATSLVWRFLTQTACKFYTKWVLKTLILHEDQLGVGERGCSRDKAQDYIDADNVCLDHSLCTESLVLVRVENLLKEARVWKQDLQGVFKSRAWTCKLEDFTVQQWAIWLTGRTHSTKWVADG